ncbi:unnamed protein product [Brachionus calyciflorus]|uniref:Carbonic anhydrase n=1 Tax=Brachionus calyciflorus TaxID=104777 RepID=A0A813MKZ2_9BILA|nr:unnamed protein product [Brachionus calyciflorus]
MRFLVFFILIGVYKCAPEGHLWNYESEGPDFWKEEFLNCKGQKQSPIDITKEYLEYDSNLKPINFGNYDKVSNWNISHNGHTVVVSNIKNDQFTIDGSDFDENFNLLQFHFHWGYNKYHGSEHLIDGEKFPLEMHLVHKSKNGTFTVLGFLFTISEENNPGLDSLLEGVSVARDKGHWQNKTFSLAAMLPESNTLNYYRYLGSLTTPPCTEGVIWNVFSTYINISSEQLTSFRHNVLRLNFRDPQKIYNRQIFTSFPVEGSDKLRSRGGPNQPCVMQNGSQKSKHIILQNGILPILFYIFYLFKLF